VEQNSRNQLKFVAAKTMTLSNLHTADLHILGVAVQNFGRLGDLRPGFLHL